MQTSSPIKLTSQQIMATLKISACHLMHTREAGRLKYEKVGNAYLYTLPPNKSILDHPLGKQLIDWHTEKHQFHGSNLPQSLNSKSGLEDLLVNVLLPIEKKFKKIKITYGFTSLELKK